MRAARVHDPLLNVAAAFALGATLTWLIASLLERGLRALPLTDEALRERVRAVVAESVGRPEAIEVTVEDGVVRLSGQVLQSERDSLLSSLVSMPGVARVRSALSSPEAT